jgi:hypothetical protein
VRRVRGAPMSVSRKRHRAAFLTLCAIDELGAFVREAGEAAALIDNAGVRRLFEMGEHAHQAIHSLQAAEFADADGHVSKAADLLLAAATQLGREGAGEALKHLGKAGKHLVTTVKAYGESHALLVQIDGEARRE